MHISSIPVYVDQLAGVGNCPSSAASTSVVAARARIVEDLHMSHVGSHDEVEDVHFADGVATRTDAYRTARTARVLLMAVCRVMRIRAAGRCC